MGLPCQISLVEVIEPTGLPLISTKYEIVFTQDITNDTQDGEKPNFNIAYSKKDHSTLS